jgi:hypothetical protein
MPPKSKLSDKQWQDIIKRKLEGEANTTLAKEFGVTEGAIRNRVTTTCNKIKDTANQIVAAELSFSELPDGTKDITIDYARNLRAMSNNMLSAGVHSSSTSAKLAKVASAMANKIEYRETMTVEEIEEQLILLKSVIALQNTANTANVIPMGLLGLNKPAAEKLIPTPDDTPRDIMSIKSRLDELDRKRAASIN